MTVASRELVDAAFSAAGIRPERRGCARSARLTEPERSLYRWSFAASDPPAVEELHAEARRRALEPEAVLSVLSAEDLVHTDERGEITVAYPYSGRPTAHRARIDNGPELYAMCAIDALGIAAMLAAPIAIVSRSRRQCATRA